MELRDPPLQAFDEATPAANYFRFRLGAQVVIAAGARVKKPGEGMYGEAAELFARHCPQAETLPYERLLGDALRGDATLFTSDACVEAAWSVIDPALGDAEPVHPYEPGTWGPAAAASVAAYGWHDPQPARDAPC